MKVYERIAELEVLRKKYPEIEKLRKSNKIKHVESLERELEQLHNLPSDLELDYGKSYHASSPYAYDTMPRSSSRGEKLYGWSNHKMKITR